MLCFLLAGSPARAEGVVDAIVRRFTESEFEFLRAVSNAPFLPLAWVAATGYETSSFETADGDSPISFSQESISQAAFAPIPLGVRDAVVIGEWLSYTHFDLESADQEELDVFSAAIPLGWIRQSSPQWQLAAFVSPLGHKTPDESWYWETLGGVFARYASSDRTAWIFGAYADVSPLEDFYTPYLGATFILSERWTINAVMPWPSVTYAPSSDIVFRLGVTPSGASWSSEQDGRRPRVSLNAWNFGVSVEQRLYRSVWIGAEAGVSGLRGITVLNEDGDRPETELDEAGFVLLTINLRPSSAP